MNFFIYVLLLSIWTDSCLNTNQSDGSSPTGAKHFESMQAKMDNYRRRLFIIVVGIMSTAFICTSFCCLHYNCLNKDVPKAKTVKKCVAAKSSRSSKISFSKYKTANLCISEKQPMLSGIDKLSESSSPEKSSISSSSENVIRSLSSEKSSIPTSTEKFINPSSSKRVSRSFHLGKSYRKHSLDKSHKLSYDHKLGSQDCSFNPNRAVRPPSPASLQYPLGPAEPPYPTCPQNKILLPNSSSLQQFTKSPGYRNLKRSVSTGRADMLSMSPLVNSCPYYKENCLVCRTTSESLVNGISEVKNTKAQNPSFPPEVKPFSKSFHKVDSRDNAFYGNVSDSDMMTYDSDDENEREITIFCNINLDEVILNSTPSY